MDLAVGEQIAVPDLDLLDGVGAVWEQVGARRRAAVLDDEGRNDVALDALDAVYHHRVVVEGLDLERGAVEGGGAETVRLIALEVVLLDLDAAALDVVAGGDGHQGGFLGDADLDFGGVGEVAVVALGLAQDVVAVGKGVRGGGGPAGAVGGDLGHHLSGLVVLAPDLHVVAAVVDDRELDVLEVGVALRRGAGLGVDLRNGEPASLDLLGGRRGVVGALIGGVALGFDLLHRYEFCVQLVTLGGLGLADHEGAARNDYHAILLVYGVTRYKLCFILIIDIAILIRCEHPRPRGRAAGLGLLLGVVEAVVVAHGELGAREARGALGQVGLAVVGLLTVELAEQDARGVVDGRVLHGAAVYVARAARRHVDRVDRLIEQVALGRDCLLHIVRAGLEAGGGGVAGGVGRERRGLVGQAGVAEHVVARAGEAVQLVAGGATGVGALLVQCQVAGGHAG